MNANEVECYCPKCGETFTAALECIKPLAKITCNKCKTEYQLEFYVLYDPDNYPEQETK